MHRDVIHEVEMGCGFIHELEGGGGGADTDVMVSSRERDSGAVGSWLFFEDMKEQGAARWIEREQKGKRDIK